MKVSHVRVAVVPNGINVFVDDWELFDYLDDYLSEHGIDFASSGKEERDGQVAYVMRFPATITEERIRDVLDGIPPEEIERIWKLNN